MPSSILKKSSDGYRRYNQAVPQALHNRPSGIVKHIMSRIQAGYPCEKIRQALPGIYNARSDAGNDEYQVWLGSDGYLPPCQCLHYKRNRLPCKHICAVIRLPNVGWESLGSRFSSHPLFTLDECVLQPSVMLWIQSEFDSVKQTKTGGVYFRRIKMADYSSLV